MEDKYGPLLFEDDLSPQQRDALRDYFEEHPERVEEWARWREVRRHLRRRLQERLPDRRLLVLYALEQEGQRDVLTDQEQAALDAARGDIADAIDALPALERVVHRIQEERNDFKAVWQQHRGEAQSEAAGAESAHAPERKERAPRRRSRTRSSKPHPWVWRLAVAALLVGAAVLAVMYGPQDSSRTTVAVADDEERVIEFDDGSTARLVGAARLSYRSEEGHEVTLEQGRAYFDVVPQDDASFVVNTPTATATVLGTQFGVTTQDEATEVVLVEGSVQVEAPETQSEPVVLEPGQRSMVQKGEAPSSPVPVDLASALDWSGMFVFRSVPVETIVQRLSQHYEVQIAAAPVLADEPVTATFERNQPVSEVLGALSQTLGAELRSNGDTYRLEPGS